VSAIDLAESLQRTNEDGTSLDLKMIPLTSEGEVFDTEWLKVIAPLKSWNIEYIPSGAGLEGGWTWDGPDEDPESAYKAWADCWTGRGGVSDPRLSVRLHFGLPNNGLEITLKGRNAYGRIHIHTRKVTVLEAPEMALHFYRAAIVDSIPEAVSQWGGTYCEMDDCGDH
jgi:hypothetical protein